VKVELDQTIKTEKEKCLQKTQHYEDVLKKEEKKMKSND